MCATRLHNFCINEGEYANQNQATDDLEEVQFCPTTPENVVTVEGNSMLRDMIVDELADNGLVRPVYNLDRNVDV
jgi:hypothetical protein